MRHSWVETLTAGGCSLLLLFAIGCTEQSAPSETSAQSEGEDQRTTASQSRESVDEVTPVVADDEESSRAFAPEIGFDSTRSGDCEIVERLGALEIGERISRRVQTKELSHNFKVTCSDDDVAAGSEYIASFRVDRPAKVDIEADGHGRGVFVEVRSEVCDSPDGVTACSGRGSDSFLAKPGTPYYAIVQPHGLLDGPLDINIETTPAEASCDGEDRICEDGALSFCSSVYGTVDSYTCPTRCANDRTCKGETCEAPIELDGGDGAEVTLEGYTATYQSEFERQAMTGESRGEFIETPGEDVVVALRDLEAGQRVLIDASNDRADHVLAIRARCNGESNLTINDFGEILEWDVPEDGTYYAVVDHTTHFSQPFSVRVQVF